MAVFGGGEVHALVYVCRYGCGSVPLVVDAAVVDVVDVLVDMVIVAVFVVVVDVVVA